MSDMGDNVDTGASISKVFKDWKQLDLNHFKYHILHAHILYHIGSLISHF